MKIEKPRVDETGISDPVILELEDGKLCIAQWDANKKEWFEVKDGHEIETFGNKGVCDWVLIRFTHGFNYDSEWYSKDPIDEDGKKALEMMGLRRPIDIDAVMRDIKKTIESV